MPLANKATKRVFSAGAYLYGFDIQDKDSLFSAYDIINEILPGQLLFVNSYRFADRNTENIDEGTSGYFTIIEQEGEVIEIRLNILNLLEENNSQTLIDFINSGDREILFKNQSDENISSFSSQEAILENNYVKILITSSELISNFDNEQSYKLSLDFIPTLHSKLILDDGSNPHGTTKDDLGLGSADNTPDLEKPLSEDAKESLALKVDKLTGSSLIQDISITRLSKTSGENTGDQDLSGYASLVNGTVPTNQLPSYVDDVLEFASLSGFPNAGETGKIYIALETDKQYRWTGSNYLQITNGLIASTNDLTEGSNNLYFTVSRVLATLLTSFTPFGSSSNLAATDSIFTALRKLQTRVALNDSKVTNSTNADTLDNLNSTQFLRSDASASFSGSVFTIDDDKQLIFGSTSPSGNVGYLKLQASGSELLSDMGADITYRDAGDSFNFRFKFYGVTGNFQISGNFIGNGSQLTALPNALVIASLLTSFKPFGSSSNISATDSIFTALRKLQTRVALNDAKSVPTNNNQLQNGAGYITSADGGNAQTLQGLNKNDFVKTTTTSEPTGSDKVLNMVSLTQAEYDAGTPIATTLYIITDQNGNGNGD